MKLASSPIHNLKPSASLRYEFGRNLRIAGKSTQVFELEHADALDLEKIVAEFAPSAAVTADARSNSLTVEATNARMNQIKNLIRTLDQGR